MPSNKRASRKRAFREPLLPRGLSNQMVISYQFSSIGVVVELGLVLAVSESLTMRGSSPSGYLSGEDVISFDPCFTWGQMDWKLDWPIRTATLVWFGTALLMICRGLWNRTVPRPVALVSVVALSVIVQHALWMVISCESPVGVELFWVRVSAVALMSLHHTFQGRDHVNG
jgi:hypothetical protein